MKRFFLLPFVLLGCNNEVPPAGSTATSNTETIEKIEVVTQGGQLGYYASTKITKDSVVFSSTVRMDSTRNEAFAGRNKDWQSLVKNIDLKDFRRAQNGESALPVDGTDTEVTITTNKEAVSKTNARGNGTWNAILMWSENSRKG